MVFSFYFLARASYIFKINSIFHMKIKQQFIFPSRLRFFLASPTKSGNVTTDEGRRWKWYIQEERSIRCWDV